MLLSGIGALDVLRVLCGVWFLPHCIGKLRHITPASQTFSRVGLRPGRAFVVGTVVAEVLAGAGLAANMHPKVAAVLAVAVLLGASYAVLRLNGWNWRWQKQGPEYMLFWSLACVVSVWGT